MNVELLSAMNDETAIAQNNEDRIFSILFQEDELTWQTIIYDLVKKEAMDPWNINISVIADKFLKMLNKMKEMDFRIGGKMVLAAATLVKLKSDKLMKEDIVALDALLHQGEEEFLDNLDEIEEMMERPKNPTLVPRTPQPRQRKVSVYDLVEALEKALATETRKQFRQQTSTGPEVKAPPKSTDMTQIINSLHDKIKKKFSISKTITFDQLIPSDTKEDKVYTFIPLLHLDNQRRIELLQKEHFGNINIKVNKHTFTEVQAQPF